MFRLELLFLMQCMLGILMIIFLHKMNQMKKQIDDITKEVKSYLTFIEEEVQEESQQVNMGKQVEMENSVKRDKSVKVSKDEVENHLIQAVLREYFL